MHDDSDRLQAYLDNELSDPDRKALADHLAHCGDCQTQLAQMSALAAANADLLHRLSPAPHTVPRSAVALATLRRQADTAPSGLLERIVDMNSWREHRPPWSWAAAGMAAVALLAVLLTVAPARQAMAQFLGVFRVQRIVAIPVPPEQEEQLTQLEELLQSDALGAPEFLREPGEPQVVANAAAASDLAGFGVRAPQTVPEGSVLGEMQVMRGPHVRITVHREAMEMALLILGVTDAELPAVDQITAEVDLPAVVEQRYEVDNPYGNQDGWFQIMQAPIPDVEIPPGVDPVAMGELYLRMAGMPATEAHRLAQAIDWTTTLVLPLPTDVASSLQMEVRGHPALLVRGTAEGSGYRQRVLIWQEDGMLFAITGDHLADSALLALAEAMR